MGSTPRYLATGIREPGSAEFRITIYGNAARELPPAVLLASLSEFRAWIAQGQAALDGAHLSPGGNPLR